MATSTPTDPSLEPTPSAQPARFVGLAWSALILGIVGIVFSPLPIINNISALVAVVGIILGVIALFGSRKILSVIGIGLGVLAVAFTIAKQSHDVAALNNAFGRDPTAMKDVTVSDCLVTNDYGTAFVRATIKITNPTSRTQSYSTTISVNDANGARIGEINTFTNSLAPGQSVTLTGDQASGNANKGTKAGSATCTVANVNRFAS